MYRESPKGWMKHFDFIVLDLICLQVAFVLAYLLRQSGNPYQNPVYRNVAVFLVLADLVVIYLFETMEHVVVRGYYREFAVTVKHVLVLEFLTAMYLFSVQEGEKYSRLSLYLMGIFYLILTYLVRILWKKNLKKRMAHGGKNSLLLITTERIAPSIIENITLNNYKKLMLVGIVILDRDMTGETICGIPVVANEDTALEYVCREWIDEVFVIPAAEHPLPRKLMDHISETGVAVHLNLAKALEVVGRKQIVEKIGSYTVLTTTMNYATPRQLLLKRAIDIAGGLVGCLITGIVFVFVGPLIYLSSPGPIFFSQVRVGKNGKKFKMYKFRSMYMDAEERKKELMKENRVSDGMMFKLDFDPRVIGNKILPDGTKKTGIGNFIRVTSLDEFPQFFNVLKGDMSIVGTRPPTLDEWEKYELHHRARLAIKPGITGMWQVSGRSDITDFEEVVKLDTEYINNWSMGLDFRILFRTVLAVVRRDGSK